MGELADWDAAESALAAALDNSGASWVRNEGDGAFYGPKIDVTITGNMIKTLSMRLLSLIFTHRCPWSPPSMWYYSTGFSVAPKVWLGVHVC